jgi:parallel beta-helix repeat protein
VPLKPVSSVAALVAAGPGHWYFDTTNYTAYIMNNPTGNKVELGIQQSGINGDNASGVTVRGLVFEKFANPPQFAALGHQFPLANWTIENNETRLNHYEGLRIGQGGVASGNYSHDNGNMGIGGSGDAMTIFNNESSANGYAGYDCGNECGGMKLTTATNSTIKGNYVHDNVSPGASPAASAYAGSPGIWCDISCYQVSIENNHLVNNTGEGIFYEISYKGTIRYNLLDSNGSVNRGWFWSSGIELSTSSGTSINGNIISNNYSGAAIAGIEQNRGTGTQGTWLLQGMTVQDNLVTLNAPGQMAATVVADNGDSTIYTSKGNTFNSDKYNGMANTSSPFEWSSGGATSSLWQAFGNDMTGTFN